MSRDERIRGARIDRIGSSPDDAITVFGLLAGAVRDIRSRPSLATPFLLASVALAACNVLRLRASVSAQVNTVERKGVGHLTVLLYPGYDHLVTGSAGALLGLRLLPLAEITAVGVASLTVIAFAVATLVARVDDDSVSIRSVASLVAYQIGLLSAIWVVNAVSTMFGFFAMLAGILFVAFVAARLFAAPVLLARGVPIRSAIRRSSETVAGHGLSVVVFSALVGTLQYWVGSIPMPDSLAAYVGLHVALGTVLAMTIVGPLGALAAVRLVAVASDE